MVLRTHWAARILFGVAALLLVAALADAASGTYFLHWHRKHITTVAGGAVSYSWRSDDADMVWRVDEQGRQELATMPAGAFPEAGPSRWMRLDTEGWSMFWVPRYTTSGAFSRVDIPLVSLSGVMGFLGLLAAWPSLRARYWKRIGRCPRCGYPLPPGGDSRCPECGAEPNSGV